eukprot:SAG31_NODE_30945_length_374_cov_0.930909_1_plen_34_part_01
MTKLRQRNLVQWVFQEYEISALELAVETNRTSAP